MIDYRDALSGTITALKTCGQWPPTVGEVAQKSIEARKERHRLELRKRDSQRMLSQERDPAVIEKGRELLRDCITKITRKGVA